MGKRKTRRGQKALSRQRRHVNHVVRKNSDKDRENKDHTNILQKADLWDAIFLKFGTVNSLAFAHIEDAEVISDSRGTGSFQRMK